MKKKRCLSFLLCAALLISVCVPAFAEDTKLYGAYPYYMCVGDSIGAGCGLMKDGTELPSDPAFIKAAIDDKNSPYVYRGFKYETVPNAYHSLVADELNAVLWQNARSATRAVELRYMLDGIYNDFDQARTWGNQNWDSDGNGFTLSDLDAIATQQDYYARFKNADLITMNVGSNDVFTSTFALTILEAAEKTGNTQIQSLADQLQTGGDALASVVKVLTSIQNVYQIIQILQIVSDNLDKNFEQFKVNYAAMVKKIYALNPDVTFVAVGVYNPLDDMVLSSKLENLNLSALLQNMTTQINDFIEGLSQSYSNYYFADVVGTQTYSKNISDEHFTDTFAILMHPTIEGHRSIARQILAALPEALSTPVVKAVNVAKTGKIKLSWSAVTGASKYVIYRSSKKNGTYSKLYTTTKTTFTNTSVEAGKSYYYKVQALSGSADYCDSRFSSPVYRTCDLPSVTGITITRKNGAPKLTWTAVEGADQYAVYRSRTKDGSYVKVMTTSKTTYTNTSAIAGKTYYYEIKAQISDKSAATSAYSACVSIKAQ